MKVSRETFSALLINPYIYDFSAYSFWSAPLGLLYVGAILRQNDFHITLIDCLEIVDEKRKEDGRAPFIKEKVNLLPPLKGIKKRLKRYGISEADLIEKLARSQKPDIILITSIMTYWYAGTKETLRAVKTVFPESKVIIGGIYPSLCYEHATAHMAEADLIVRNNEIEKFYHFLEKNLSIELRYKPKIDDFEDLPYPCFDLYGSPYFVPLLTSFGCIYRCAYCATPFMYPRILRRRPEDVIGEVIHWHQIGVKRFVLYDDNFLYDKINHGVPILKGLINMPDKIDIYNPNAMNAALIDYEIAELLMQAGFKEIRIGLETTNPELQKKTGNKVNRESFERAIKCLKKAGFKGDAIGVYVLAGLPLQKWTDVKDTIDYLIGLEVRPHIAEYTPIPHTRLYKEYNNLARYPITKEPLYQNNALFPFSWDGFTEDNLAFLKGYVREKIKLR
ncbi:MAG TPA: radical SAM protein [Syntrophorhabdaceae bacterium]|nr:radical SAM protein [Syntrophorhabdaceae bacterium]